jgi:hypothetical protein
VALGLATVFLIWFARDVAPSDKLCPDYICYWATGKIMLAGQSPYDVELQTRIQHEYGWDKQKNGLGAFDFLPYYYTPWFAWLTVPFVPLGYHGAQVAWFVFNADLILLTGYLLRRAVPGLPPTIPLGSVPIFAFTIASLLLGQTTPVNVFLIAVALRLLDAHRDWSGGSALALLVIKPQQTVLLVLGTLLWMARRRRWSVFHGFAGTSVALSLISWLLIPGWLGQMLNAPFKTPPPTAYFPWIGTTWFLLLKSLGVRSWAFWGLYALIAGPLLVAVCGTALDRTRPLHDVFALSLIVACVVAPYGRHYDFPFLLIPLFVIMGTRVSEIAGTLLLVAVLLLPYLQYWILGKLELVGKTDRPGTEVLFAWLPLLLAAVWFASGHPRARRLAGERTNE